jgi:septal ring factor EnvC (AmiA/AmiB activator)
MSWVSQKVLHEQTGIAVRTLQYISAQEPGVLVTRVKGKVTEYKQPDCAINLRNREIKKQEDKPTNETQARTRKLLAEAAQEELKLAKLRGQLITVEDYERELRRRLEPLRARLMAFPGRLAPQLVEVPTPAIAQGVIDSAVRELLKEMQQDADRADEAAVA